MGMLTMGASVSRTVPEGKDIAVALDPLTRYKAIQDVRISFAYASGINR